MPSAKKFLQRSTLLLSRPRSFSAARVSLRQLDRKEAIAVERMILERIRGHLRLAQIGLAEIVEIDDQNAVRLQVRQIHLQRRRIHGDQRVHGCRRACTRRSKRNEPGSR